MQKAAARYVFAGIVGAFVLFASVSVAHAAAYYVDDNACPKAGTGTQTDPFCSIQAGLNKAQPGDTVYVADGRYYEKAEQPRGGTTSPLTGQMTCTKNSKAITGTGTNFTGQLKVGDFVRCRSGHGFRWTEIASIESNTALTLKYNYPGPTATNDGADMAKFIKILGNGSNPDAVILDAYDEKPTGLTWKKLSGYQNIWYYDTTEASATGAWKNPQGFHELRSDTDYYSTSKDNGADPYFWARDNACPWGGAATALQGMDIMKGSYTIQGTRVFVHTRDNVDPNTVRVRASRNPEYSAMLTAQQPYTIIDGFSAWGGLKHIHRGKAMTRSMTLGASNTLFKNLKGYNGGLYTTGVNGLTDTTFKNVRGFFGLTPPVSAAGSAGYSGLLMEDIEGRGSVSNVASTDGIWGVSSSDRVIFRNWYIHAGTSHKEGPDCGEGLWYDWRTDTWADGGAYDGPHGLYIGSQSVGQPTNHITIENSIFEMNYDGLGLYHGGGANDIIIQNNIFGLGGNATERLLMGSTNNPGKVIVRNNIFYREDYRGKDDWNNNGAIWTYGGNQYLDSDNNLFLHPTLSGPHSVNKVPNQATYTLSQIQQQGKELHSIEVSSGGKSYFVDGSVLDGTKSDYHLLTGSPAINKGDNTYCSATDRDGNPRTDGYCDIGPYEYNGGTTPDPDTQVPSVPTNLQATPSSASQINLTWTASTDNIAVTGYRIYRSQTSGGSYTQVGTSVTPNYTDTGLTANTTYYYVVRAHDAAGNVSGDSNQASATTQQNPSDTTAPSIPTNLAASAVSSSQINLTWTASTDNIGVTGYNILRSTTNGSGYTKVGTSASTSYSDTGLTANTTYYYVVQAYDAANNTSGNSNQASATTQSGSGSGMAITTGEFFTDEPTLHNLAFRWLMSGDTENNAAANVQYRKVGDTAWKDSLPLLRNNGETAGLDNEWTSGNLFSGSVVNLEPGTSYEVKITITDPNGVTGQAERIATATTRVEPIATITGTTRHVYPSCAGVTDTPCYTDIVAAAQAAQPGDLVLIHDGTYRKSTVDLQFLSSRATTAVKPIVFRGTNRDTVIFDGGVASGGSTNGFFSLNGTKYIYLENFTIQNAGMGIVAPRAENLVVRKMKIQNVYAGIFGSTTYAGTDKNWYIADNEITGWNTSWAPYQGPGTTTSSYGIMVYGKGHVVEFNKVGKFYDCLAHPDSSDLNARYNTTDYRNPPARSIDFNNNDLYQCTDDGIVADYSYTNFRIWNNRITNAHSGISVQPVYGGPVYIFRNEIYNLPEGNAYKTHNKPAGLEIYHNSTADRNMAWQVAGDWQNARIMNNLFMGDPASPDAMWFTGDKRHPQTKIDYNGIVQNSSSGVLITWNAQSYKTNSAFYQATGYQQHGFTNGYGDFQSCSRPQGEGTTYTPGQCDFRLKSTATAVDKGTRLPGINDTFAGVAPDAGAFEVGAQLPQYGVRSATNPPTDTQAPSVPTNLSATAASTSQINLTWTASTDNVGVTGYNILRSTTNGSGYTKVGTSATPNYSDTGLTANTTYYYVVQAYDAANNTSGNSNQASATTQGNPPADIQAPSIPTNLSASAVSTSQINLTWTASTDNVGVTGYNILRSTTNGSGYVKIGTSVTTTYANTGLTPNTTYYYVVQAYDAASNTSGNSNQASATTLNNQPPVDTQAPTVPATVKAAPISSTQIVVTWNASTDNVGVTGYKIYRSTNAGSGYALVGTAISTSYQDSNLVANTTYYYVVSAQDAAGNTSVNSNEASATTLSSDSTTPYKVILIASPSYGAAPLNNVTLTARVTDTDSNASYTYTFYCNRYDSNTQVTGGFQHRVVNTTDKTVTVPGLCSYPNGGTYLSKVIVQKGTNAKSAQSRIIVTGGSKASRKK